MSNEHATHPVVVVGAGPAGLATAAMLRAREVPVVVIERADQVGASWRGHYDRLRLHTPRWLSHLPGYPIPRAEGRWVTRDGVVRYLESYAAQHGLDVRTGVEIARIDRWEDGWALRSPHGDLHADAVVVATGYNHTPAVPEWPGRDDFRGELLHASKYRNGSAYRGRDVLVVGTGNTGAEIAVDLSEHGASRVWLAVRTPPHIVRREQFGVPAQLGGILLRRLPTPIADALAERSRRLSMPSLRHKGLPEPDQGLFTRAARGEIPIQDVGLVDAILADRVEPVPALVALNVTQAVLADGSVLEPDAVVMATGYRRGLAPLVGHLGLVDDAGRPVVHGPRTHSVAPGLHFIGYTNPISGMFREIAIDARRIAAAISKRWHGANQKSSRRKEVR